MEAFEAFAASEFELGAPQDVDGKPLREHLQSVYRQTGVMPDALANAPSCPRGLEVLWRDFLSLHGARGTTGFGPARISYADLDAFQRVQGVRLPSWQIDAIRRADSAYLSHFAETHKPAPKARRS